MKLICKVSLKFQKLPLLKRPVFGGNIINSLKELAATPGNLFTELPVSLDNLKKANDKLAGALANARTGSHVAMAAVKIAGVAWNADFKLVGAYINTIAIGQPQLILSTGYLPTKSESQPRQKPLAITDFKITPTRSKGTITAGSIDGLANIPAYIMGAVPAGAVVSYNGNTMIITIGGQNIYIAASTRAQTQIKSMSTAQPYNVFMYCINSAGIGPSTPMQPIVAQ
jgi:hypothetical protein